MTTDNPDIAETIAKPLMPLSLDETLAGLRAKAEQLEGDVAVLTSTIESAEQQRRDAREQLRAIRRVLVAAGGEKRVRAPRTTDKAKGK